MDFVRAKTPAMVQTGIWSCLLAYNLIRMKMLQSCAATERMPRTLSFATTLQLLANNWLLARVTSELVTLGEQKLQPKKRVGINPIVSFTALGIGSLAIQGKSIGLTCQDLRPR